MKDEYTKTGHRKEKEPEQNVNLDDYAGDEKDHTIAREQANNYIKDVDKAMNKKEEGGDDASQAG